MRITTSCQWCNIQQLQERYFGIIANWLITWNTIPSNHLHRGMIFQSRDCCRFPSPLHRRTDWVDGREKWWNNVIRWLNWWHNKRVYKLITDCDVISKLWLFLSLHVLSVISIAKISFPPRHPTQWKHPSNILRTANRKGARKTYFPLHSVIKFTFILRLEERENNKQNKCRNEVSECEESTERNAG